MRLIITTIHDEEIPDIADNVLAFKMEDGKFIILFNDSTTMSYNAKEIVSLDLGESDSLSKQFPSNMIVH